MSRIFRFYSPCSYNDCKNDENKRRKSMIKSVHEIVRFTATQIDGRQIEKSKKLVHFWLKV